MRTQKDEKYVPNRYFVYTIIIRGISSAKVHTNEDLFVIIDITYIEVRYMKESKPKYLEIADVIHQEIRQ